MAHAPLANDPAGSLSPADQKLLWSKSATVPAIVATETEYQRGAIDNYSGLVIPAEKAKALGVPMTLTQYHLYDANGAISKAAEKKVTERLSDQNHVSIERGFQRQDGLILAIVSASPPSSLITVTLISTALALAEQQSDMGTPAAVGATKGTRRRSPGSGGDGGAVGVGLRILVGLVAGVAMAYPATSQGLDTVTGRQLTLARRSAYRSSISCSSSSGRWSPPVSPPSRSAGADGHPSRLIRRRPITGAGARRGAPASAHPRRSGRVWTAARAGSGHKSGARAPRSARQADTRHTLVVTDRPGLRADRDFVRFWTARQISVMGSLITAVALPVLIYRLTHSATLTAMTTMPEGCPI